MADGFIRRDVSAPVNPEVAFLELVAPEDNGFWLDDSLGETVSYLGLGAPVTATDGFTEFTSDSDLPVSRVGWISYGERESTLGVTVGLERHKRAVVLDVDVLLEIDHRDGSVTVFAKRTEVADAWSERLTALASETRDSREPQRPPARSANWRDSVESYSVAIDECLRHITDGDAYQLCLTTSIDVPGEVDPVDTYLALRRTSPTRHGGFIRSGGVALLSSSPETFLTVRGRVASTKPIKGTRPRSMDSAEDQLLRRELLDSDKERAENLMIVDLCRNDLSTVCEVGSVHVPALHVVETYSTVHQLVSTVSGTLADGVTPSQAARALFPAGSMTGAPKRSAVEILGGLESGERGMYSGVFGFAGRDDLTFAMTIRSIIVDDRGASIGVGGGITAGSNVLDEVHEVGVKADALLRVLGASPNLFLSAE
jgi:anthranilate/para-aminobenzoate synthase component I